MATPTDLLRQAGRGPSYDPEAVRYRQQRKQEAKQQPTQNKPAVRPNPVGTQRPQEPMTKFPTNPQPPGGASPPILAMPLGGQAPNMGKFDPNPVNPGTMGPGSVGPGMGIQQLGGANGPMPPDMKMPPPPGISGSTGGPPPPPGGPGMSVGPIGGSMPPGGAQGFGIGAPPPGMSQAPGMDSGGGGNPFPGFRPGPPQLGQVESSVGSMPFRGQGGPAGAMQQMQPPPPSPYQGIAHIAGRMQPPQAQPQQPGVQRPGMGGMGRQAF